MILELPGGPKESRLHLFLCDKETRRGEQRGKGELILTSQCLDFLFLQGPSRMGLGPHLNLTTLQSFYLLTVLGN